MRTTVRMGGKLLEDAKNEATREHRSLNDLIVEALEQKIYSQDKEDKGEIVFSPPTHKGGLPRNGIDLTNNSQLLNLMDGIDGSL